MKNKQMDLILFITTLLLLAIGVTMVLSASAPSALTYEGDSYHYFRSQLANALIGIGAMFFLSFIGFLVYHFIFEFPRKR